MNSSEVDQLAGIIWDYHHLNQELKKSACIFVLGSHDTGVAEYAADLFLKGYAPYIIFSGGFGRLTTSIFTKSEAEIFSDIAISKGVPEDKVIIENKSSNTGENIEFTKEMLEKLNLDFDSFIVVQKPYMERRTYASFKKIWPEKEIIVTSQPCSLDEYVKHNDKDKVISIMVGDLQRIKIYPERGFQIFQEIPTDVRRAYEKLVECGFTEDLINT